MITLNLVGWSAEVDGRSVQLTPVEFNMLWLLSHGKGVVSHNDLNLSTTARRQHLTLLRRKLGPIIRSERGQIWADREIVVNRSVSL